MFVIIWAILLFPVRGSNANRSFNDSLPRERLLCLDGPCPSRHNGVITAEAGLCVVIPCFPPTRTNFKFQNIVWLKCEPRKPRCDNSDVIFDTNEYRVRHPHSGPSRVSLLDPLSPNDCSIVINDLTESDSGLYEFRVGGSRYWMPPEFKYSPTTILVVEALTQKPTVIILPLAEGQQTTLTCIAPALCSGSVANITWTWRGRGENEITGNTTTFMTENLTAVMQKHISSLTFNPSVTLHHGTGLTCKVSFANNIMTEVTVTLNVTLFPQILENSGCEIQSEVLTCVCISRGFPLPTIKWPLLKDYTEYFVTTMVSHHSVTSTIVLTAKNYSNSFVDCLSITEEGKVQRRINIVTSEKQEADQHGDGCAFPWAIAAVSILVNVICIICMVYLWNTRKKAKSNQEDRTYMSLKKRDVSPEYDVIGSPRH